MCSSHTGRPSSRGDCAVKCTQGLSPHVSENASEEWLNYCCHLWLFKQTLMTWRLSQQARDNPGHTFLPGPTGHALPAASLPQTQGARGSNAGQAGCAERGKSPGQPPCALIWHNPHPERSTWLSVPLGVVTGDQGTTAAAVLLPKVFSLCGKTHYYITYGIC